MRYTIKLIMFGKKHSFEEFVDYLKTGLEKGSKGLFQINLPNLALHEIYNIIGRTQLLRIV